MSRLPRPILLLNKPGQAALSIVNRSGDVGGINDVCWSRYLFRASLILAAIDDKIQIVRSIVFSSSLLGEWRFFHRPKTTLAFGG